MLDVNSTKKKGYGWAVSAGFYAALATISAKFITPQVFISGPWWYFAFYKMINPFFTQRTKSKYIAPEFVPVQYGALSRESEQEFTSSDLVTERIIKHATKHTIKFSVMRLLKRADLPNIKFSCYFLGYEVSTWVGTVCRYIPIFLQQQVPNSVE